MLVSVAKAVASALQGLPFGQTTYSALKEFGEADLDELCVNVSPRGLDATAAARGPAVMLGDYRVAVIVQRHVSTDADIDSVVEAVEMILDQLASPFPIPGDSMERRVAFQSATVDLGADDTLNTMNTFVGAIELTLKVLKP